MFYTGNVTGIQEIDIPEGMYIEDIETIGRYAIFCGRTMTTNPSIGIIGYLNIDDFIFTSPASVTVNWRFVDSTTNVKELVVQEVLGQYHVVALGEKLIDNYITYFAVENTDLFSPLSQFDVAKLSDNSTIRETAYEIKMTNEYFVLIGTESQDKALYFRRCSRSIGLTDTEFDNIYYLPAPPQEALSKTHSTPTYGNVLAISYLSGLSGSTPFSIKIRTLDVGKLLFYNSQEIRIDDKAEPSDIIYLTNANRLVLLQDLYFPFGSSAMESLFIDIVPSTVPYVTPVYYYSGCLFYKVDNIDYKGSTYIALGDRDRYMIKDDMSPWPGSDASCPTKDNIKVCIISELSIFSRSVPLVHSPISTDIKTDLNIVVSYPPNPLCTSD